jgi:hypothetical protein
MISYSQSSNQSNQTPYPSRSRMSGTTDMTQWPEQTRNHMLTLQKEFQDAARELGLRPPVIFEDVAEMFLWADYDGPDTVN